MAHFEQLPKEGRVKTASAEDHSDAGLIQGRCLHFARS